MSYLKIGDWRAHANGNSGMLHIREIDELGRVSGTFFDQPITGWWSERARRLTFAREGRQADQAFEGYAWDEPVDRETPRAYYLAGSYETFGGGGGAKDRQSFGWFATLAQADAQPGGERERERDLSSSGLREAHKGRRWVRRRSSQLSKRSTSLGLLCWNC